MTSTTLIDRAVLRLSGEDVRGFLQGLVTHDLELLAPDRPLWAGLLTPQGKALFDFILWADADDVLIDCEAEAAGDLARRLTLYRLRRKIAIERVEGLAVHWAQCSPAKAGAQAEGPAGSRPSPGHAGDPRLSELGRRWLAPPDGPAAGWLEHRLRLGVTEGRAELGSDKTLWLECNAAELNGVSFTKGCYVGQENTARMNYRSKVNRRLVVVPAEAPGERTRIHYPELGLAVDHRRVEDLGHAIVPEWLAATLGRRGGA
jgi:tRNA-modifying protein YgfZ